MPKKGGRKPSARKAQTQAALQSVVRHTTRSQQWGSSVGTEPAATAAELGQGEGRTAGGQQRRKQKRGADEYHAAAVSRARSGGAC